MTTAELIPVMVDRIVQRFHPLRVILFGSHVRGQARPDSDVDLLVVLPSCEDKREATLDILRALDGIPVRKDVIVTTPDEIAREGTLVGTVLRPALREGKVLYEREKRVYPVNEPGPAEIATVGRRWLRQARRDLRVAQRSIEDSEPAPEAACWHAQQAAEKALKSVLVFLQIEFPYTHDLDTLRDLIPSGWRLKDEHTDLKWLAKWSVEARYPGDWPDPTEVDALNALQQARAVYESVLRDFERHGFDTGTDA